MQETSDKIYFEILPSRKRNDYGLYNYHKSQGGRFKDFPWGAPVVSDKNQVVAELWRVSRMMVNILKL